jgi:nucleoside-diphosphate-sugar epimerase
MRFIRELGKMKIGVIGLGHIGYPIASHLHSLGHEVHSWTRSKKDVSWKNSVQLDKSIELNFDVIFLASGASRPNLGDPNLELESTLKLVSNFSIPTLTRVVYISSGAIYGECEIPQSESSVPNPITDYGKAKLHAEKALFSRFGDQLCALRLGNIIDEINPYGIVAHLSSAIEQGFVELFGEPTDCRDYLAISDFIKCVQQITDLTFAPRIMNIGTGKSISLQQMSDLLQDKFGHEFKIIWGERRIGDLSQTRLNVDKMNLDLQIQSEDPVQRIKNLIDTLALSNHFGN